MQIRNQACIMIRLIRFDFKGYHAGIHPRWRLDWIIIGDVKKGLNGDGGRGGGRDVVLLN